VLEITNNLYSPAAPGIEKIRARWQQTDSMAGVGIDPDISRIPQEIWDEVGGAENICDGIVLFNQRIIDATAEFAVDFKVNSNFFQGEIGRKALSSTFKYLKETQPDVIRVCDGKFADVGHTADVIAEEYFGELEADAVLLNPYMGFDAIKPFVDYKDRVTILCIKTSNPSAQEIQNLELANGTPLWRHILRLSMTDWNYNGNIVPVLSATHMDDLEGIRDEVGDVPILLAGVGSQGGDINEAIPRCLDSKGFGLMISSSRGILYPEKPQNEPYFDASRRAIIDLRSAINSAKAS